MNAPRERLVRRVAGPVLVAIHRAAMVLARRWIRFGAPGPEGGVHILLEHAWGLGGTVRTTLNLASWLSQRMPAEIVSMRRGRKRPRIRFPKGVVVTELGARGGLLARLPSLLVHPYDYAYPRVSLATDVALVRRLRSLGPGAVLVGTRPAFNLVAARLAPPGVVTIGVENMHFNSHRQPLAADIRRWFGRLDALVVLTDEDERDYAGMVRRVRQIPNAVPRLGRRVSNQERRVVVAAGRLTRQKGFDLLLKAWVQVHAERPNWKLRIYGGGRLKGELEALARSLGLESTATFEGPTKRLGRELARGSVFALSSRFEGFGMVLVEAMSKGLPVVSFDCPNGPAEIVSHGVDGLLIPPEDVDALARGLLTMMGSRRKRKKFGAAALRKAERYSMEAVGARWDALLDELGVGR